jgi:hypothetical protein
VAQPASLPSAGTKGTAVTAGTDVRNVEGLAEFDVHWRWQDGPLAPGISAVLRVKDEAASLGWVLPPLLEAVREVVLVDNGSTDGTPELAQELADKFGALDRLFVAPYPHAISRCGEEHLMTPPTSVHSLTYFNNWAFSHVRTTMAMKWDGDMALSPRGVAILRDLSWQLAAHPSVVAVPRQPIYVTDDQTAYVDLLPYREPNIRPNGPGFGFTKAFEWELGDFAEGTPMWGLNESLCVEIKHATADEFDHWTSMNFEDTGRTARKAREWRAMQQIGNDELPDEFVRVEAPEGEHVVDHLLRSRLHELQADLTVRPATPGQRAGGQNS